MVSQNDSKLLKDLKGTSDLVALWDFKEAQGEDRKAYGIDDFPLKEAGQVTPRINEGPLSGYSASFGDNNYLILPNSNAGSLNIFGYEREITVMAWVKWQGDQTGFIGGMWNEYKAGGQRQYGLFVSLPYYNGANQVCGHISKTGKPTPPFPYSIDYSASAQIVAKEKWQFIAFTYDGHYIKSYLNGRFMAREPEPIKNTIGFDLYPKGLTHSKNPYYFPDGMGDNGSDFTVGAVLLKTGMGNFYKGLIGGLAVFDRALSDMEINDLGKSWHSTMKK